MSDSTCKPLAAGTRLTQLAAVLSAAFGLDHGACAGTVTDCGDGGGNTLRNIVAAAGSGENVDVSQCSLITLTGGEIASNLQKLRITGSAGAPTRISGNYNSRVINHTGTGGYLLLRDVIIEKGNLSAIGASGGCLYSAGTVVNLEHMTLRNCTANSTTGIGRGGGLFAKNSVNLVSSVITGNTVNQASGDYFRARGGGIYAVSIAAFNSTVSLNAATTTGGGSSSLYTEGGGVMTTGGGRFYGSTIANNSAGKYAGLRLGGNSAIVNSTVSSNGAVRETGGVWGGANLVIANSTVAFNYSIGTVGTAGVHAASALTLQSSIIANNTQLLGSESDLDAASIDPASANNLIMSSTLATPADTIHADPHLLPLAANGGATLTHALRQDSPALDRGNNTFEINFVPITCDQRGNPGKPQGNPPNTDTCSTLNGGYLRIDSDPKHSHADIGAYEEQQPNPDWIFYDGLEGDYL